jgi:hypothetical protein
MKMTLAIAATWWALTLVFELVELALALAWRLLLL